MGDDVAVAAFGERLVLSLGATLPPDYMASLQSAPSRRASAFAQHMTGANLLHDGGFTRAY
ncbi:hypothetical protein [Variovorax guangxiensis]|uniref:hypothetical protein n=1 Tax=Variovorax guangxiensis TaxID=1775474 RepID=UPI002860F42F|nr:hypothetical protein [Variovorax guangxiensis]MDR6858904.1 hypothetical protein [Variovorax guangxiensis]